MTDEELICENVPIFCMAVREPTYEACKRDVLQSMSMVGETPVLIDISGTTPIFTFLFCIVLGNISTHQTE